jgi:hypothetical protein
MLAVGVDCPSLVKVFVKPDAKSAVSRLNAEDVIVVLGTTGCPVVLIWNMPVPLKDINLVLDD